MDWRRFRVHYETLFFDNENKVLLILDQTKLPGQKVKRSLQSVEQVQEAIRTLAVRGAPAIGIAAAYGLYLAGWLARNQDRDSFLLAVDQAKEVLASARPTAVNLIWALDQMIAGIGAAREASVEDILKRMKEKADALFLQDEAVCRSIGEHALALLSKGQGLLTHCNAGRFATVRYGTATAPMYLGHERGYNFKVFVDETRPLLQGARITAFELQEAGLDVTLICDNMAASVMAQGKIQAVLTGCDRVAANGDAANKIGTLGVAILAKHFGIPFYICAPSSTIDGKMATGKEIPIEQRSPEEVTSFWYESPMAPDKIKVLNPAFDVTPWELITAIITEEGVHLPPYHFAEKTAGEANER